MASTVNTSVDYNKLESAKSQINEILTEMMETSSEIGKIINSISALDDAGIDPAVQYGGYSSPNYSAEHGHDGCFNELPSELENLQTSLMVGICTIKQTHYIRQQEMQLTALRIPREKLLTENHGGLLSQGYPLLINQNLSKKAIMQNGLSIILLKILKRI